MNDLDQTSADSSVSSNKTIMKSSQVSCHNMTSNIQSTVNSTQTSRSSKSRCACGGCKKKTKMIGFDCRCGFRFCLEHRSPESHSCTHIYKSTRVIEMNIGEGVFCKVDKI
uniref:AN1-type domain-containing protein n=1 Tax=Megaviridae environmental sample TaxID=1737588 RepID=A0A5J6VH85_9VIRU|nr:MAG: hypothetical protein [Megaviridae environmental sample]